LPKNAEEKEMEISRCFQAFALGGCLLWMGGCTADSRSPATPAEDDEAVMRSQGGQEEADTHIDHTEPQAPPLDQAEPSDQESGAGSGAENPVEVPEAGAESINDESATPSGTTE
jgi:hypothetical protein